MTKLIIFDCDGVLVNSEEIYISVELDFIARQGVAYDRETYIQNYMGLPHESWVERLFEDLSARGARLGSKEALRDIHIHTYDIFAEKLETIPGIPDLLDAMRLPVCVASSSGLRRLRWKLEKTDLLDYFAPFIFSSELVTHGKPAPDLFLHAAKECGFAPKQCVVVEDSVNGVLAGKAAGMYTIGFCAGGHCSDSHKERLIEAGADAVCMSAMELVQVLGQVV